MPCLPPVCTNFSRERSLSQPKPARRPIPLLHGTIWQGASIFKHGEGKAHCTAGTRSSPTAGHIQCWYRRFKLTGKVCTRSGAAWQTGRADRLLVTFSNRLWTCVWHNSPNMPQRRMGGTVTPPIPWMYLLSNSNGPWCSQGGTKPGWCYWQGRPMASWFKKGSLMSFIAQQVSFLPPMHCRYYQQQGKTPPQPTTHYRFCWSTSHQETKEGTSKPTRSLTTAMMLVLASPPWDYPLYVQLTRQVQIKPHPP